MATHTGRYSGIHDVASEARLPHPDRDLVAQTIIAAASDGPTDIDALRDTAKAGGCSDGVFVLVLCMLTKSGAVLRAGRFVTRPDQS